MNSSNYAITGPGGATNNSVRKNAKALVTKTVRKSYFRQTWKNRNQAQNYAIWNQNGSMVGFALIKKSGEVLDISLIGAQPGKGIGSRLMQRIIDNAGNRGIKKITLDSVPAAAEFYIKYGFVPNKVDDEHIYMSLNLSRPSPSPSPVKKPVTRRRRVTAVPNARTTARAATAARSAAMATRRTSARQSALAAARKK